MEYLDPLDYVDGIFNDRNWDIMTAAMTAAATVMTEFAGDKPGTVHGGSREGRRPNINRDFKSGHDALVRDYFGDGSLYEQY
ncbi:hypothetical protein BDR26DRAFT_872275 [Obelidium mucronatum]|nr:hypothetical protein BDR26DRAFT_872275 [Obelidium mucronatum]